MSGRCSGRCSACAVEACRVPQSTPRKGSAAFVSEERWRRCLARMGWSGMAGLDFVQLAATILNIGAPDNHVPLRVIDGQYREPS